MARRPKGVDKHLGRIRAITSEAAVRNIGKAVYWGADQIRVEARRLVNDGAIQGKGHIPSKPGEPPNSDTLALVNGMLARTTGPLSAEYASTAPHSAPLQWGSSKMAPRPYADVAANNKRKEIVDRVGGVISDSIRKAR